MNLTKLYFSHNHIESRPSENTSSAEDYVPGNVRALAPHLLQATNRIRIATSKETPLSRKMEIFGQEIQLKIIKIQTEQNKALSSKKYKFLATTPCLKETHETLLKNLTDAGRALNDAMDLMKSGTDNAIPIFTMALENAKTALEKYKGSVSDIASYERKSVTEKKFPLITSVLAVISSAIPIVMHALGPAGVGLVAVPPLAIAIGAGAVAAIGLVLAVSLYRYHQAQSTRPGSKLHDTKLELEELTRCFSMMEDALETDLTSPVAAAEHVQSMADMREELFELKALMAKLLSTLQADNAQTLDPLDALDAEVLPQVADVAPADAQPVAEAARAEAPPALQAVPDNALPVGQAAHTEAPGLLGAVPADTPPVAQPISSGPPASPTPQPIHQENITALSHL